MSEGGNGDRVVGQLRMKEHDAQRRTNRYFAVMNAQLGKLMGEREKVISMLGNGQSMEYTLLDGVTQNVGVKLVGMKGNCKITFTYPNNQPQNQVLVYCSHDTAFPGPASNSQTHINPMTVGCAPTLKNQKTGKLEYQEEWFYLSLVPKADFRIKLLVTF